MKVTLTIELENDDADSVAEALDAIADTLADVGYEDGEWCVIRPDGWRYRFMVSRGETVL